MALLEQRGERGTGSRLLSYHSGALAQHLHGRLVSADPALRGETLETVRRLGERFPSLRSKMWDLARESLGDSDPDLQEQARLALDSLRKLPRSRRR